MIWAWVIVHTRGSVQEIRDYPRNVAAHKSTINEEIRSVDRRRQIDRSCSRSPSLVLLRAGADQLRGTYRGQLINDGQHLIPATIVMISGAPGSSPITIISVQVAAGFEFEVGPPRHQPIHILGKGARIWSTSLCHRRDRACHPERVPRHAWLPRLRHGR